MGIRQGSSSVRAQAARSIRAQPFTAAPQDLSQLHGVLFSLLPCPGAGAALSGVGLPRELGGRVQGPWDSALLLLLPPAPRSTSTTNNNQQQPPRSTTTNIHQQHPPTTNQQPLTTANNNNSNNNNKVQTKTAASLQDILFLCLYKGVETKSATPSLLF